MTQEDRVDLLYEILEVYKVIFTNWQHFNIDQRNEFYERFKKIEANVK